MVLEFSNGLQECDEEVLYSINGGSYSTWFKAVTISLAVVAIGVALAPATIIAAPVAAVVGVTSAHTAIYTGAIYLTAAATGN